MGEVRQPTIHATAGKVVSGLHAFLHWMDGKPRIVAIDDEVEFIKTIESFFSSRGYEVHIASTGSRGLELIQEYLPQVVLVDLKLPGMDGDELFRRIKTIHPATKTIFVTAYSDAGKTKKRLLSQGAFAYFDKPLSSLRDLAECVKQALANPSPDSP